MMAEVGKGTKKKPTRQAMSRIFMRSVKELGHKSKINTSPTEKQSETNEPCTDTGKSHSKSDRKKLSKFSRRTLGKDRQGHVDHHTKVVETPHRTKSKNSSGKNNHYDSENCKVESRNERKINVGKEKTLGEDWSLETFDHCQGETFDSSVPQNEREPINVADADLNNNESPDKHVESLTEKSSKDNTTADSHGNHLTEANITKDSQENLLMDGVAFLTEIDNGKLNTNNSAFTVETECNGDRIDKKPTCNDKQDSLESSDIDKKSQTGFPLVKDHVKNERECKPLNSIQQTGFRGKASKSWSSIEHINKLPKDSATKPMWNHYADAGDNSYRYRYGHTHSGYKYGHNNWNVSTGNTYNNSGYSSDSSHYNKRYSSGNTNFNSGNLSGSYNNDFLHSSGNAHFKQRHSSGNSDYNSENPTGNSHFNSRAPATNAWTLFDNTHNYQDSSSYRSNEGHSPSKNYKFSRNSELFVPPRFRHRSGPGYEHGENYGGWDEKYSNNHGFIHPNNMGQPSEFVSGHGYRQGSYRHYNVNNYNRNDESNVNYNGGNNFRNDRNGRTHPFNKPTMNQPNKEQTCLTNSWNAEITDIHKPTKTEQKMPVNEDWLSEIEEIEIDIKAGKIETNSISNSELNVKSGVQSSLDENNKDNDICVESMIVTEKVWDSPDNADEVGCDSINVEKDELDIISIVPEVNVGNDCVDSVNIDTIGNNDVDLETKDTISTSECGSDKVVLTKLDTECREISEVVESLDGKVEDFQDKLVVDDKVPYLPPIPDEILQEYDRFEEVVEHADFDDIKCVENRSEVSAEMCSGVTEEMGKVESKYISKKDEEISIVDLEYTRKDDDISKDLIVVDTENDVVDICMDVEDICMNKEITTIDADIANNDIVNMGTGMKFDNNVELDKCDQMLDIQSVDIIKGKEEYAVEEMENKEVQECLKENIPLIKIEECSSGNMSMDCDIIESKGKYSQFTPFLNEDSSSVSSLVMKAKGPCAFSIFDSASEADVSDICFDDRKIFEALESQSSDGELKQGLRNLEREYQTRLPIDHDQQYYSTRYGQFDDYNNAQKFADEVYTKDDGKTQSMSEYYPYGYDWWYHDAWYEQQMRYHWDLYHRSYYKSFGSVEDDQSRRYDASGSQHTDNTEWTAGQKNFNQSAMVNEYKSDDNDIGKITCNLDGNEKRTRIDPVEEMSENSNFGSHDTGARDDMPQRSKNKLSKYWSKRMERWVQKQYAHAKYFQDVNTEPVSEQQNIDNSESRNSANNVKIDHLKSKSVNTEPEVDNAEAKNSLPDNDKDPLTIEVPSVTSDVKCLSTDCKCKTSDVQFIVWRTCKCSAGNPPKLHQVLPCNHDDGNLDMGYLSYESLESVNKEEKRTGNKPPGFLIHPMKSHRNDKESAKERQSKELRKLYAGSLDRDNYPHITGPPPGFVNSSLGPTKKEMEDTDEDMSNSEINNNLTSKIYQPLTLKEIIQQHNSSQSSDGYSPSDSDMLNCGDKYSDMPKCIAESATHLEEAVEKMEKAEIIEKKLYNALYVVNKRINDIQKDIHKKRTLADIIKSETYGQTENKDVDKVDESSRKVNAQQNIDNNGNVKEVHGAGDVHQCVTMSSLHQQKEELICNHSNKNSKVNERQKSSVGCQGSGDNMMNYSPEFEIPENEMMDTNVSTRSIVCDNESVGSSYRPPYPYPYMPSSCRPHVKPPSYMPPHMGYFDSNWAPPPPYPHPFYGRMAYDPRFGYRPRYSVDLQNKLDDQKFTYNQNPLGPYPLRPLVSPRNEETVDCNRKSKESRKGNELRTPTTPDEMRTQTTHNEYKTPTTPSVDSGLKLIESYDTSDDYDDDNDDSPEIRPFDVDSIGSASDMVRQPVNEIRKPTPKKFKKTETWSAMSPEKAVQKMDVSVSRRPTRGMRLKQKVLKSFNSAEPMVSKSSPTISHTVADESRQGKRKKSMAEIIAMSTNNTGGERLGHKSLNDLNTISSDEAKNLPDFPPLPPFPNSPFWCMYQPEKVSALCGKSPELETRRSSYESNQLLRRSFDGPSRRYSCSPGYGSYSPSENDNEKASWRKEWRKNFKLFHDFGVKYIDTHCHLDFLFNRENFKGTFPAYMEKHSETFPELFEGCVAVFCNPASFNPNAGLWLEVAKEPNVWIAMGCHPKNATEFTAASEYGLKKCLQHKKCVALGEIGLDYSGTFRQHEEIQKLVFRCQLKMAIRYEKPIVIHSRDAEDDCIGILKEIVPRNWKIHCHCFTNAYKNATKWINEFPNLFIGVTPLVTYRSATPTHDLARKIPLNKLLLETDAPYFIPSCIPKDEFPLSNPGVAITVAKEIAQYQEVPVAQVLRQCRLNTRAMYGI